MHHKHGESEAKADHAARPVPRRAGPLALVAAVAAWLLLAGVWPDVTFHLAPGVVTIAWAMAERLLGERPLTRRRGALLCAAGAVAAGSVTLPLAVAGHLAGPALVGADAAAEAVWVVLGSAVVGWAAVTRGGRGRR